VWTRASNTLSNLSGVTLQSQVLVNEQYSAYDSSYLRVLSGHVPHWYLANDATTGQKGNPASIIAYDIDNKDNDQDGRKDEDSECDIWDKATSTCKGHVDTATKESSGHAGFYFDLPGKGSMDNLDNDSDGSIDEAGEKTSLASERVIKDAFIRDGKLIILSFIPDSSPCSGGGSSVMHEINANTGGRMKYSVFDINGDKKINDGDYVTLANGERVSVTGKGLQGLAHPPVFLTMPDKERELKIFSNSSGTTDVIIEKAEQVGMFYWREVNN